MISQEIAEEKEHCCTGIGNHKQTVLEWAYRQGWMPPLGDLDIVPEVDPKGFLVLFDSDTKQRPVSCIANLMYCPEFSFLGFYLVGNTEDRGKGYGLTVWNRAMRRLEEDHAKLICLEAIVQKQPLYEKYGFEPQFESKTMERMYSSTEIARLLQAGPALANVQLSRDAPSIAEVADFEMQHQVFPVRREKFLRSWLGPHSQRCALFAREYDGGPLVGYAVARECIDNNIKIGPLFATNSSVFRDLMIQITKEGIQRFHVEDGCNVIALVPVANGEAMSWFNKEGYRVTIEYTRMYYKCTEDAIVPSLQLSKIYSISCSTFG